MKATTTTWDLSPLLTGDDDPTIPQRRQEVLDKCYAFINKWKDRDDYLQDQLILKEALDEDEEISRTVGLAGDESYYFWLRTTQDQADTELKAKSKKVSEFIKDIYKDLQFFGLRVAKIAPELQPQFLNSPELKPYRHHLERAFAEAKYQLSEPEEKILMLKSDVSHGNWVEMTDTALSKEEREILNDKGEKEKLSFASIMGLIDHRNKDIRDQAAAAVNDITFKLADMAEAEINSILEDKKINDEIRGIERPDLTRHLHDDIDSEVVDQLIKSVSSNFPTVHKFYELKAKLLGLPKLAYHERNMEYGEIKSSYPFEDALALVVKSLGKVDKQFAEIVSGYNQKGQLDIYPRKGKADGAFCAHMQINQPSYILLNHTDKLNDVLTLAHECGHGINNELIKEKQNAINFGTPMSTAEVASTFMEDFVLEEIMQNADDEEKLAIIMMKLNGDISTIYRQVACYMFEQELHATFREKGYLSKQEIGEIFQKHMRDYMGDFVEQSPGAENWWVYWSHIRNFFYVYSYASGLLISKSLQSGVKQDPTFVNKVKEFLSAGLSDSPKNIFANLGIDISDTNFWNKGLEQISAQLDQAEELAKKLGKI